MAPEQLALLTLTHWGFDGKPHQGELVVHRQHAPDILMAMQKIYDGRFPIERMELVDNFKGDDNRSMEANNTSAFNCRKVQAGSGGWSEHAYGRAIDINPVQNPSVSASKMVSPPSGRRYAVRSQAAKGMIHPNDPVVTAFRAEGWKWGGEWRSLKDYQHFSATGR